MAERYVSALTGPEMDAALLDMAQHNSEAWAVGTRNGAAVSSSDETYDNNSKYYATEAEAAAARAEAAVPAGTEGAVLFSQAQSLTDAQKVQARSNISAGQGGTNPNLLDNPWFTINQRGVTSGNFDNAVYRFDRWYTSYASNTNGTWSWGANGVTLTSPNNSASYLMQKLASPELLDGKRLTASLLLSDGTVLSGTASFNHATNQTFLVHSLVRVQWLSIGAFAIIVLASQTITIRAVKLEVGGISTIANDAPPNYADELAKCQRYFYAHTAGTRATSNKIMFASGWVASSDGRTVSLFIPTPVPMADVPANGATTVGAFNFLNPLTNGYIAAPTGSLTVLGQTPSGVTIQVGTNAAITTPYVVAYAANGGTIRLSAEL